MVTFIFFMLLAVTFLVGVVLVHMSIRPRSVRPAIKRYRTPHLHDIIFSREGSYDDGPAFTLTN